MVYNECNLWAGIYKVQTFGTTHSTFTPHRAIDIGGDRITCSIRRYL